VREVDFCYKCTISGSKELFMNIFEEGTEERQNQKKGKKVYIETKLVQFVKMREQYEEFQRI